MTKDEMILFGKAVGLLRKAKFHYNAQKAERDVVVEKIQELLSELNQTGAKLIKDE